MLPASVHVGWFICTAVPDRAENNFRTAAIRPKLHQCVSSSLRQHLMPWSKAIASPHRVEYRRPASCCGSCAPQLQYSAEAHDERPGSISRSPPQSCANRQADRYSWGNHAQASVRLRISRHAGRGFHVMSGQHVTHAGPASRRRTRGLRADNRSYRDAFPQREGDRRWRKRGCRCGRSERFYDSSTSRS